MKWTSNGLAMLAAVTGLVAALYWYRSSTIQITPTWITEPGDEQLSQAGWITGALKAFSKSADLNAKAARWTASSVMLYSCRIQYCWKFQLRPLVNGDKSAGVKY
jgi:hypothetical protein